MKPGTVQLCIKYVKLLAIVKQLRGKKSHEASHEPNNRTYQGKKKTKNKKPTIKAI